MTIANDVLPWVAPRALKLDIKACMPSIAGAREGMEAFAQYASSSDEERTATALHYTCTERQSKQLYNGLLFGTYICIVRSVNRMETI